MILLALFFQPDALRTARVELGLTQEQAAHTLGVDVRTYRRYETGEVNDDKAGFRLRTAGRRQLIARIGAEFGLGTEELLQERAAEDDVEAWSPRFEHAIQPARHFVGREPELSRLRTFIEREDDSHRVVAIVAVGGSGKSALIERALADVSHSTGQFVWSFYEDPRADAFIAAAYRYFLRDEPPASSARALDLLVEGIGRYPGQLWVLDGFETMQSDGHRAPRGSIIEPDLRRLVRAFVSGTAGSRLLVTSRYRLVDLEAWEGRALQTLELAPLGPEDQLQLLSHYGVRAVGPAHAYLEQFGGHALSVATLASYVSAFCDGELSAADEVGLRTAAGDDMLALRLTKLLDAYADSMAVEQSDLLSRLAAFPRGTDADTLLTVAGGEPSVRGHMPTTRRDIIRGLSHLESLGLVYRSHETRTVFAAHPFVASYFRDRLADDAHAVHDVLREQLENRLRQQPRSVPVAQQLDMLEDLLLHTLMSGRVAAAFSVYRHNLGGFGGLGLRRGEMTRGHRIVRALMSSPDDGDAFSALRPEDRGDLWYDAALFAIALGDLPHAERALSSYLREVGESPRHRTTGLRTWAYALRLSGDFDAALGRIDEALQAAAGHEDHLARNFALRGAILDDRGEHEAAAESFARARTHDPVVRFRRALWEAEHALRTGDPEYARASTEANRAACVERDWTGHVSHCDVVLGWCALPHDPTAARRHLEEARDWGYASGEVEARLRCDELELAILVASNQADAAERMRGAALERATACGFGRFVERMANQL